jgi:uncharacterized membrane protein
MSDDPATATASGARLSWPAPPPSPQTLRLSVLGALALVSGIVLTQPAAPSWLTTLAGVLLALALPGMALTRALFPGPGLGRAERVTLTIGLQLALIVVCGFLLHTLRQGLNLASWGALLADITLVACAVAWVRSRRVNATSATPSVGAAGDSWFAAFAHLPTAQLAMLVGAGVVAALALGVARAGVVAQPQPPWTALGIAAADGGRAVDIDITNAEGRPETYRLVATLDGEPLAAFDDLVLADDGTLTQAIALPRAGAFLRQIDVGLWRSSDPEDGEPYRSVRLSLRGVP